MILRFHQLGHDELWIDEALTGFIALTNNWLFYLTTENTPPLYYLLQRCWCFYFNCDEFILRVPSVLYGIMFICIISFILYKYTNKYIAILTSLIIVASPIHIYYSQEARVYSLLLASIAVFLYLQNSLVINNNKKTVFLFVISCICTLFLHYLSIVIITACFCVYLFERLFHYREIPDSYFLSIIISIIIFIPWLWISILGENAASSETLWITNYFYDKSIFHFIDQSITTFLIGPIRPEGNVVFALKRYPYVDYPSHIIFLGKFSFVIFLIFYSITLINFKKLTRFHLTRLIELSAFLFLPLFILLLISILIKPIYVIGRYDLIAYPSFILLFGYVIFLSLTYKFYVFDRVKYSVLFIFFTLTIYTQTNKLLLYWSITPITGAKQNVIAIERFITNKDVLLISAPDAIITSYYLHAMGYNLENKTMSSTNKRFTFRLYPETLEYAPGSIERFQFADTERIINSINLSSTLWVQTASFDFENQLIIVDQVSLKLLNDLRNAGWNFEEIIPKLKLFKFNK